jgi:hypothetical protein
MPDSPPQPSGIFVDCQSHWKGRFGHSQAISFAKYQGGVLSVGTDGPDRRSGLRDIALHLACRVRLVCRQEPGAEDYEQPVLIRQENDPAPKFHFLEEGPVRLGMRVAFDLLDDAGHYHGDGRQDIWLYPNGDIHCTFNMQIVDRAGHGPISDAFVEVVDDGRYTHLHLGPETLNEYGAADRPFGISLEERAVFFENDSETAALFWARDEGHVWTVGSDHGPLPPFYASRWPTGMQQWARGGMGWACHSASAGVEASLWEEGSAVRLCWLRDERIEAEREGECTFTASLIVARGADRQALQSRIEAVQKPLEPSVLGGSLRCYTEEDGTYEIGQIDPTSVHITFPPDPLARDVCVRFFRRKTDPRHRGGVVATVDGQRVPVQLVSEGELTDDICVPIEMSHRRDSVDDVLVGARLHPERETVLRIEKVPGIQAVYQSEIGGVDLKRRAGNRRDLVVWSSHNQQVPLLEFDLFSGAVHRLTHYGSAEPVVWEMPMAFFKSCGISKHHYCSDVRAFRLDEDGPDAIALYFCATNPNGRAQSETWLRIPYDHPRPRLEVRMRFTALEQWDDDNVEFSDIFPYPSRLPETWFHDAVLFVSGGESFVKHSYRPDLSGGTQREGQRLFYALYPSQRGNVLTLIDNPDPAQKMHYSVCGNYVDIHVNFHPPQVPAPAGTAFEVRYICEVFGDEQVSVDQLKQIGLRATETGDIHID